MNKINYDIKDFAKLFIHMFKVGDISVSENKKYDLIIYGEAPFTFTEELVDEILKYNWSKYKIVGLEKYATPEPWSKGTNIGLGLKIDG